MSEYTTIETYRKLPERLDLGNGNFIEYVKDVELYRTQPEKKDEDGNVIREEKTILQETNSQPMQNMDDAKVAELRLNELNEAQQEADYKAYQYAQLTGEA